MSMVNFEVSIVQTISSINQSGQIIQQVDISRAKELALNIDSEIETRTSIILSNGVFRDRAVLGKMVNYINQSISIGKCFLSERSNELIIEYRRVLGVNSTNLDSFLSIASIHCTELKELQKIFDLS